MTAPVFVDTNVFIYALDPADAKKQSAAQTWRTELWKSRRGRTSFQVLQEFYANVIYKWPTAKTAARMEVRTLLAWGPVPVRGELMEEAWRIQDRYQLSFWDALIVAAAKAASCSYLLTEDLQANQNFGELVVVNPFHTTPASI